MYVLICKSLIDFNEAFTPYNELQFLDWPIIVAHSPAGLMYVSYGLVILHYLNNLLHSVSPGLWVSACGRRADLIP